MTESTSVSVGVPEALDEIRGGRPVILVDPATQDFEPRLMIAAQFVTPDVVELLREEGTGPISVCMGPIRGRPLSSELVGMDLSAPPERIERAIQAALNRARAGDRSAGARVARPRTEAVPGQSGHLESAMDLVRLAGLVSVAVTCRLAVGLDASQAGAADVCSRRDLRMLSVRQLVVHRWAAERLIGDVIETDLPTMHGAFRAVGFEDRLTGRHHLALMMGDVRSAEPVLTAVHSRCLLGDVLRSVRCDCKALLNAALNDIAEQRRGVLVYLTIPTAPGALRWGNPGDGDDMAPGRRRCACAAARDVTRQVIAGQLLAKLGVRAVRLLTGDARGADELTAELGIEIVETVR